MGNQTFAQKVLARAAEIRSEQNVLEDIKDMTDTLATGIKMKYRHEQRRDLTAMRTAVKELADEAAQLGEGVSVDLKDSIEALNA